MLNFLVSLGLIRMGGVVQVFAGDLLVLSGTAVTDRVTACVTYTVTASIIVTPIVCLLLCDLTCVI